MLDYRAILAAALAAGYAGPMTIEFLAADARPVEDKLADDVAWLRGLLAELGARGERAPWPRIASLRTPAALRDALDALGLELPCDDAVAAGAGVAARRAARSRRRRCVAPNRFVVQPMEGWDGTDDGLPSELTSAAGATSARSGAGWSGAARRWRCAPTAAPTRTSW